MLKIGDPVSFKIPDLDPKTQQLTTQYSEIREGRVSQILEGEDWITVVCKVKVTKARKDKTTYSFLEDHPFNVRKDWLL